MNTRNLLIPAVSTPRWLGRCNGLRPRTWFRIRVPATASAAHSGGETLEGGTDANEMAIVALGGTFDLESTRGKWNNVGSRANVFTGMPSAVVPSHQTSFTVKAVRDCDLAFCYCRAEDVLTQRPSFNPRMCELKFGEAPTPLARSITS